MSGELGVRLGKGNWTEPPPRVEWQDGIPPGWGLTMRSRVQRVGMTVKAWQLEALVEITAPSGQVHQQLVLIMDRVEEN